MTDSQVPKPTPALAAADELLAEILLYVGHKRVAKYSIGHGEYILGSDPSCPLVIKADNVARHHARLTFHAFDLVIEDLGSGDGVFIEGIQIKLPTLIRLDQEVQIGNAKLFIRLREAAAKQLVEARWDEDLGLAQVLEQLEGKKYKAISTVSSGGMGVILQTRDLLIRRTVAMKVMKSGTQFSRENLLRFIDEAQLTGQLEHPNIVPVYELGLDGQGEIFYTMKFVRGVTLAEVIRKLRKGDPETLEKYPLGTLLIIFQKICDAVAFAHSKGVIHRDLKPDNIMIGAFGEVLVMDWGLAKNTHGDRRERAADSPHAASEIISTSTSNERGFETMHGVVVGTPPYLSPEQCRGERDEIDGRSDIYVLGAILYIILTLRPHVAGDDVLLVLEKITSHAVLPPTVYNQSPEKSARSASDSDEPSARTPIVLAHCPGKRVPDGLSAVTMKALALDPAQRYQKVEDLQADIAAYQGGFATKAEKAGLFKHLWLFTGRHKIEITLASSFAIIVLALAVGFFLQLTNSRDRALNSEQRALEQEKLAAFRLAELRGNAPIYARDAQQHMDAKNFSDALEKIDHAIDQVPNEANYHCLRGHILQAQLRLDEAAEAYEEALRLNPKVDEAEKNLALTRQVIKEIGNEEQIPQAILLELYTAIQAQGRKSAAENIATFGLDKQKLAKHWREALDKRGLREQRFETNPDNTINVDLSKVPRPDFKKLRDLPVSGLILDDTRITDIVGLNGLPLGTLSLARTAVRDLKPLEGMPLHILNLESSSITDLEPLREIPLTNLKLTNTRVSNLEPLQGSDIEQLSLAGCRAVTDIQALLKLPLQTLILSHTRVKDITPLTQSPLRELYLEGCTDLTDLRPLMEIATLESVIIPRQCTDIEFLRKHPGIKRLSYVKVTQSVEDFWKEFDAQNKSKKPPEPAPAQDKTTSAAAAAPVNTATK